MKNPPKIFLRPGFTLVELLTVIAIIAILMGILFPTIGSAIESAKKTQAKNDELQLVNAVKSFYTEYGKYPVASPPATGDFTYGPSGTTNDQLLSILRAKETSTPLTNPRKIVFLEVPDAKGKTGKERSGIALTGPKKDQFLDPWGNAYNIGIDTDYDNVFTNPYTSNAGSPTLSTGVISWTIGRDGATDTNKLSDKAKDDVISWQ